MSNNLNTLESDVSMSDTRRNNQPMLRADNVSFSYGTREILHEVSLDVYSGEIIGVLGPNGTGKSTLLGVLTGDLSVQHGVVQIGGKSLQEYTRQELARTRSVMPQASEFPFSYLVYDVVSMGRSAWGTSEAENAQIVRNAMQCTDVAKMEDRDIMTLSGGEAARVTLARVVAQEARVVFLDEPTAALDIAHQERTMQLCRNMAKNGDAVIAIMHDIQLAAAYCDRISLLKSGRVVACGTPSEVLTSEQLSFVYDWPIRVIPHGNGAIAIVPERS
ncbi:heme ABC transporter ATP-binding protein [Arcanobacterium hippocoleae]|uniref:heme ABC transporter ATP-binding protein n=1 Tax=Arcanobacterium hippocoleae TaxID=149017 RepID=UPI003341BB8F